MPQDHKQTLLTLALLALVVAWPEPSHGTSDLIISRSSARERMLRAGRDTTANDALDSILAGPTFRWRRSDVTPRLRNRIHLNAADVPRFPNDDPKWMDPRNWPPTMIIEGALCSLTVYTSHGGGRSAWSRSIEDSGATNFRMYYTDVGTNFHSHYVRHRGPLYDWLRGRLRSRSWTKGRGSQSRVRSYMPYPSGELFTFMEFQKKYDATGYEISIEWIEEVFARDGTLIGFCQGPIDGGGARCIGYWLGADVGKYYHYQWAEALERSLEQP